MPLSTRQAYGSGLGNSNGASWPAAETASSGSGSRRTAGGWQRLRLRYWKQQGWRRQWHQQQWHQQHRSGASSWG